MGITIERIGALRHRIQIQNVGEVSDGIGGQVESWVTSHTLWAKVKPLSSRERLYSQQIQYQRSHEIIIRYQSNLTLTNKSRILYDSRTFQVKGVRNADERKAYFIIDCEENQGT